MPKTKTRPDPEKAPMAMTAPKPEAEPGPAVASDPEAAPLHDAATLESLRANLEAKRREVFDLYEHDLHAGQ